MTTAQTRSPSPPPLQEASDSHLDLSRAPYVLYGVKYIDLVSLALPPGIVVFLMLVAIVVLALKVRQCMG